MCLDVPVLLWSLQFFVRVFTFLSLILYILSYLCSNWPTMCINFFMFLEDENYLYKLSLEAFNFLRFCYFSKWMRHLRLNNNSLSLQPTGSQSLPNDCWHHFRLHIRCERPFSWFWSMVSTSSHLAIVEFLDQNYCYK